MERKEKSRQRVKDMASEAVLLALAAGEIGL